GVGALAAQLQAMPSVPPAPRAELGIIGPVVLGAEVNHGRGEGDPDPQEGADDDVSVDGHAPQARARSERRNPTDLAPQANPADAAHDVRGRAREGQGPEEA